VGDLKIQTGKMMKVRDLLKRINGLSTPWLGVSWETKDGDKDHAQELITYLEDRRVLYNPSHMEVPYQCVESVIEIRKFLTSKIGATSDIKLVNLMKGMRSACRKFLDTVGAHQDTVRYGGHHGHSSSWVFNGALGEL
jgi:hypothetical protein